MASPLRSQRYVPVTLLFILAVVLSALTVTWASTVSPRQPGPQTPDRNGRTLLPMKVARQITFRQIGPAISGGRVTAVAGVPGNPDIYFVGAADGGVFRTTNAGVTWKALFQHRPVASVGALAVDAGNPSVVWLGTGEANIRNDVSFGDGVYKSEDGGDHWTHLGLDSTLQISRILINPRHSNVVLVAAMGNPYADSPDRGVFRTTDGGQTWSKVLYVDAATGVADIAMDPKDPQVLYAAAYHFRRSPWHFSDGGPEDGIYKSVDGGETWSRLTGHGLPKGPVGRIGLAVAPSAPNIVYAVMGTNNEGVLWRSDDAGAHWTMVSNDDEVDVRPFYFSHIAVDPGNPDHVFALSMYLMESRDGGHSFHPIDPSEHPDNHAIWIDPLDGNRILDGNDGGIILSRDNGRTWAFLHNLAIGQFYHVAADNQSPYDVCGGLQDNSAYCGLAHSPNPNGITERDWYDLNGGDGIFAVPDPSNPNRIYNSTQNGWFMVYDRATRQRRTVDPYPRDFGGAGVADLRYRFNWDAGFALSPANPEVVYFGANVVFRSTDGGLTAQPISPDLTRNDKSKQGPSGGKVVGDNSGAEVYDTILSIAPSPKDANVIWVGTDDGLVQLTRDGGAHWTNVTGNIPGLPPWGRVETVDASSENAGTAVIAVDFHFTGDFKPYLYQTTDYGRTWKNITGNLPAGVYAHVVRQDLRNPNLLYAGLENGLYVSWNDGKGWYKFGLGLPDAAVYDLALQPQRNDLIVATHGRSLWVLDDLTPFQQYRGQTAQSSLQMFPARSARRYWPWSTVEQLGDGAFYGTNPPFGAEFSYYLPQAATQPGKLVITDAQGRVVRTIEGLRTAPPGEPGAYQELLPATTPAQPGQPPSHAGMKELPATPPPPTQAVQQVTAPPKPGQPLKVPRVPVEAGLNRAYWDLRSDGPVRWNGTKDFNKGPKAGAMVPPGVYTATLIIGNAKASQKIEVFNDPRSHVPPSDMAAQYRFEESLLGELSQVDAALNRLDAMNAQLAALKQAVKGTSTEKSVDQAATQLENAGNQAEALLTSNPRAIEDTVRTPDRLREQLMMLAYTVTGADGAPTPAEVRQQQRLRQDYLATMAAFDKFLAQAEAFNRTMAAEKLPGVVVGAELK
jgi:photosystem II stability/assembly factor-like uncharacterized protein